MPLTLIRISIPSQRERQTFGELRYIPKLHVLESRLHFNQDYILKVTKLKVHNL